MIRSLNHPYKPAPRVTPDENQKLFTRELAAQKKAPAEYQNRTKSIPRPRTRSSRKVNNDARYDMPRKTRLKTLWRYAWLKRTS